ncbi:alkaline phosphatase D family protein [Erythrobacter litoralis]|uniref:alkaline phosphatase D family protein n=1 Tax=Erythrobacter litoralis TaxID=39960 RepID=UPI002434C04F|nr:alkaline phosphatase D family protein [Erythrobacter litoralis]
MLASPLAAQTRERGFTHGIASGEPSSDGMLLWTRFVAEQDTSLAWEVTDPSTGRVVAEGSTPASPQRDWCAKAEVSGLAPGTWYYYRFTAPDGSQSDIGRTRTLPQGPTARWRMAVFSCSNIGFGWFNAYRHAAEADAFDMVAHLGDYIYEYGLGTYPSREQFEPGRVLTPETEIVSLADYRLRHADYRRDPDLQRLTQLYPMIMVWDDHESANDSWEDGAQNHQPDTEGPWDVRKAAAIRAYREWLPVSDAPYKRYEIGDLATLFALDTRLLGRDEQFDFGALIGAETSPDRIARAFAAFRDGDYVDPARQLLGAEQEAWLFDGLQSSRRAGKTWQVLAQQVIMGKLKTPTGLLDSLPADVPDYVRQRILLGAAAAREELPLNMDAWDGYPAARDRVLAAAREADADLVVLSGDSHNGWGFNLDHAGERAGVEFAGHSVTSPGYESAPPTLPPERLAQALREANPQLAWADTSRRGYMALELTPERASSEYRFIGNVRDKASDVVATQRLTTLAGQRKITVA